MASLTSLSSSVLQTVLNNFAENGNHMSEAVRRLSSGLQVHSAQDNPPGVVVAESLRSQIGAASAASKNVSVASSLLSVTESAWGDISDALKRIRELSVAGANDSLSATQRSAIVQEIELLHDEVNDIASRTTFNGLSPITGALSTLGPSTFTHHAPTYVTASKKSVLEGSDISVGDDSVELTNSALSLELNSIDTSSAESGTYTLATDGAGALTLTRTITGAATVSQTLTIVSGAPASASEVQVASAVGNSVTLDFSDLGVELVYGLTAAGGGIDVNEFASVIASVGMTSDPAVAGSNFAAVSGANWSHGYDPATYANLKVIISASTGGSLKLGTTTGLSGVRGYNGETSDADGSAPASWTDGTAGQIAFTGSQTNIDSALASLQASFGADGKGSLSVDIVPTDISINVNADGSVSYYQIGYAPDPMAGIRWSEADTAARATTFSGLTGYLSNVTSTAESNFLRQKLGENGWIGASDYLDNVNDAITARNLATGETTAVYADQAAVEGHWYWVDGPEVGLEFYRQGTGNVSGGTGQVTSPYSDWAAGEPNNWGGDEGYAYLIGGSSWNDYRYNNSAVLTYVIEYGGSADRAADTSRNFFAGTAPTFEVGDPLQITGSTEEWNVSAGLYKLTSAASGQLTLNHYGSGGGLLESQTLTGQADMTSGQSRTVNFSDLGVTVTLKNHRLDDLALYSDQSGLKDEVLVTSAVSTSTTDGLLVQSGVSVPNVVNIDLFRDGRLGVNTDIEHGDVFNDIGTLVMAMSASTASQTTANFQSLETKVLSALDVASGVQSRIGAMMTRFEYNQANLGVQREGLTNSYDRIMNVDTAKEVAALTRGKIMENFSNALIAQANASPNTILKLLS
jgi:flagellin-like hook-associated protein FlgL